MSEGQLMDLTRETLWLIIRVSAPLLIISLVVGLVISILMTITSIQEQTLSFVPKLLAIFLVLIIAGHWMMTEMAGFFTELVHNFTDYIR